MTCTKMSKHIYQKQNTYFSTIYISCFLKYICDENNSTKANGVSLVVTYNPAFKNFSQVIRINFSYYMQANR